MAKSDEQIGIKDELQEYLSKSNAKPNIVSSAGQFFGSVQENIGINKLNWFSKGTESGEPLLSDSSSTSSNNTNNGWFNKAQTDPLLPSLTRKQRIIGFMLLLFMGIVCFSLATVYIPVLVFKARKFSLLYTLGSLFTISSFAVLWGPVHHMKHICSGERLPFTIAYFGSMFATVYFAISWESTVLTVIFACIQITALLWYVISYIPGGHTGLKFFTKLFTSFIGKGAKTVLPI